ncbi:MAG: lysophospholipase [Methylococcaceae bacterium]
MKPILKILLLLTYFSVSCTPQIYPPTALSTAGRIAKNKFHAGDGAILPFRSWLPKNTAQAVIIAVHGFNDYSHFFHDSGEYFSQHGIASYAFDQRGFGETSIRGLWPGIETLKHDLTQFTRLIKSNHPDTPIYLLGESMGGAVVMVTMADTEKPEVDGIILSAPAVWSRQTMPWYQRTLLWTLSHTLPWMTLTGRGVIKVTPSDNIEMLRELGSDPLIIKETRVETIYGLVNLMDTAFHQSDNINSQTLLLYGAKDEIIPIEPVKLVLSKWFKEDHTHKKIAIYENGYHMLLRDHQASTVWQDVATWIKSPNSPLPSGFGITERNLLSSNVRP